MSGDGCPSVPKARQQKRHFRRKEETEQGVQIIRTEAFQAIKVMREELVAELQQEICTKVDSAVERRLASRESCAEVKPDIQQRLIDALRMCQVATGPEVRNAIEETRNMFAAFS